MSNTSASASLLPACTPSHLLSPPLDAAVDVHVKVLVLEQGRPGLAQPYQGSKWRRRAVELPSTVVGEDYARRAEALGELDIGDGGDALDDDGQAGGVLLNPGDVGPGEVACGRTV